jgi:hypothetical protein
MLLAGGEATELLFGQSDGCEKDYVQVCEIEAVRSPLATQAERDQMIALLRGRAANLMRKKVVGLIRVARRLEERGELTSREVRLLIYGRHRLHT